MVTLNTRQTILEVIQLHKILLISNPLRNHHHFKTLTDREYLRKTNNQVKRKQRKFCSKYENAWRLQGSKTKISADATKN